jgi:hypothetical protein
MINQLNEYKKSLPSLHSFRVSVGMAYNVLRLGEEAETNANLEHEC